jgi:hypothetical protein
MALADTLKSDFKNPQDALFYLAGMVEDLQARVQHLEQQQVEGWDQWSDETPPLSDGWEPNPEDEAKLTRLREELAGNADADESKVLRAEIELTEDRLKPPVEMHDNAEQITEQHTDTEGNVVVELPPPTPEQIDSRSLLLPQLGLADQYGKEEAARYEAAFVKGGPLLFYYTDRDFINSLPPDVKQALVEDVLISSPKEAHDMGRDVLKDLDPGTPEQAIERQVGDLESGSIHNAP